MKFENLQDCIIEIRDQKVLLDVDVAEIYGVETRDINKAVANNPDKFPVGYVVELSKQEKSVSFLNSITPYMKMILPPFSKGGILSILVVISGHKSVR